MEDDQHSGVDYTDLNFYDWGQDEDRDKVIINFRIATTQFFIIAPKWTDKWMVGWMDG